MATKIQVQDPKQTYDEIKELIELHYKSVPRAGFDYASMALLQNTPTSMDYSCK